MKNFVKENWYKLMIGSSLFIFSVGFFINSVSPVYSSKSLKENTEIRSSNISNLPIGSNGVIINNSVYFVDGGYLYCIDMGRISDYTFMSKSSMYYKNQPNEYWKTKLP
jgi:hypothetical protein